MQLREYQHRIIAEARELMRQGIRAILITSPCGSGKTILSASMLKSAESKNMAAWFIVHRRELIKQSILAFNLVGVRHGIIANGFMEAKRLPIQIAGIQSLIRRYQRFRGPTLMVWDECHHLASNSWSKIFQAFPHAFHIGLTASPIRLDGAGLGNYFQRIVHGPSVSWLIENGFLSKYKIFAPSKIDTRGLHSRMGDFLTEELSALVDKPTITGDAIKHYRRLCYGKRAVVFCVSIEHSKHVVAQFNAAGIPASHVDGETDVVFRDSEIKRFESGEIKILSNVELFGEGFDLPAMEAVIMLRPTQSLGMYIQQTGRVLRPSPGKECAIIIDHAGNCERHGLPDEERNWTLTTDKIYKKDGVLGQSVKICPSCFAAQFSGRPVCLFCGYAFPIQSREVAEKDGDLVEVNKEEFRKKRRQTQGQCRTMEELVEEGQRRGYKRPWLWAKYIFNARQKRLVNV